MARQRTGQLIWRKSGWSARITMLVDGERIRKVVKLDTESKAVARRKLAKLAAKLDAEELGLDVVNFEAAKAETFSEAAGRIFDRREADGVRDVGNERRRFRLHIEPLIGKLSILAVNKAELQNVLDAAAEKGLSKGTLIHVRRNLQTVLGSLWRAEMIPTNPLEKVEMPRGKVDRRERAVLTDEELAIYLAWSHPNEAYQLGTLERQVLTCVSRMFGGLRTGDLHSITWESLGAGAFVAGWAPREKTGTPQLLEIPAMLRPILRDWWERHGRASTGLVFPVRSGSRAGKQRKHVSHAWSFKRDLRRAFGLDVLQGEHWVPSGIKPTARQVELLEGNEHRRAVDFHSWRRAYNQALADAGVNAQQAQALAGHASMDAHSRYLRNTSKMRSLPEAALPDLAVKALPRPNARRGWSNSRRTVVRTRHRSEVEPPIEACEMPISTGNLGKREGDSVAGFPAASASSCRLVLPATLLLAGDVEGALAGFKAMTDLGLGGQL